MTLLFVDLDRFKYINDRLGQDLGDRLLKEVAQRLARVLGTDQCIGRIGADEFAVCFPYRSTQEIEADIAQPLVRALGEPYLLHGREVYCTASIGLTQYPDHAQSAIGLLQTAERSVLEVKARGGNEVGRYSGEWGPETQDRLLLESHLRRALARNEFTLHYQPLVDAETRNVVGAESLLRWHNPALGAIPPDQFIPIAEDTGLIVPIGDWVLNQACRQAADWQRVHQAELHVAVNISGRQLRDPDFLGNVYEALLSSGLPPKLLDLEITETALMEHSDAALEALQEIKELGVKISIDDFGTGYSSLSRIRQLPVSRIKIDRSFVQGIADDPDSAALIAAIVALCRELRITVIAEGVEQAAQRDHLSRCGCHILQGYLFGRPMPAAQFPLHLNH